MIDLADAKNFLNLNCICACRRSHSAADPSANRHGLLCLQESRSSNGLRAIQTQGAIRKPLSPFSKSKRPNVLLCLSAAKSVFSSNPWCQNQICLAFQMNKYKPVYFAGGQTRCS